MKKIDLGKITIPVDDYASQGNAILGIRDSGKSYTATAIAERLMDCGIPIIAFDPIGIWRNLRVPGAGKGYEVVVAGGRNGDLPLTARGAQEIVRAAMRENVSLVVDLYDIHLSKADWREVVGSSIRTLLYENGDHGLRHIFIEEASEFCPQLISPDQGRVYAEVEKLARMGGNAKLGYTLINQRAEQVNKAVLELCDCMILHRQKGRNSLTALAKWLDIASAHENKSLIASLPGLAQGECWVWPAGADAPVRTKIPAKNSMHPDRRSRDPAVTTGRPPVDVSAFVQTMRTSLEDLVEQAKTSGPHYLNGVIKTLRAEVARLEKVATAKAAETIDVPAIQLESTESGRRDGFSAAVQAMRHFIDNLMETPTRRGPPNRIPAAPAAPPLPPPSTIRSERERRPEKPVPINGADTIGNGGLRRIMTALAQCPKGLTAGQIGIRASISSTSGTFNTYLGQAKRQGWIVGSRQALIITEAGLGVLGAFDPLPTGRALLEHWLVELGNSGASRILNAVADVYPSGLSKESAAAAAELSPTSGTFNTYVGKLRRLDLITGKGELRATDDFFH